MLPNPLKKHIEEKIGQHIITSRRASGGSINQAVIIELDGTGPCFLKWNETTDPDLFVKEVKGLDILRSVGTDLRVPDVIDQGTFGNNTGYLLLEFIQEGQGNPSSSGTFGRELAAQHKVNSEQFGLDHDNYIGKLPQSNARHDNWTDFFINERMEPQLKMAFDTGRLSSGIRSSFQNMYRQLPGIFPDEPPSLLHGDLWGGNYFFDDEGCATVYDPAIYFGNREIELAFTQMFGGFSSAFYSAYNEAWPLAPDFTNRKDVYNLYPLLVHTNLFGGHYGRQVESIAQRF